MAEQKPGVSQSAESNTTITLLEDEDVRSQQDVHTVRLRLRKPKSKKQVKWGEGTVDNEHMNRKKSKCCCVYTKPRAFGESSSSDSSDMECENCHGHVERKKKNRQPPQPAVDPQQGTPPVQLVTL